nr:hypothetical protein CFP56_50004 [Quercus suber]
MKIINLQLIIVYHIRLENHPRSSSHQRQWSCPYHPHTSSHSTCSCPLLHSPHTSLPSHILQTSFHSVKSNAESNACLIQQQASKQDDSIQLQGKQQVGASDHVLRHQGASCATPQKRETLQLDTGQNASEGQRKNRDPILRNEDLEDLIELIPHHDQIIHSIQEMYPSPFAHGIDHTTEGGLDTFVTPDNIPDVPDNSDEFCVMPNPTSFPTTSSNNDSLPSDSIMQSNAAPIVVPNSYAGPPPPRKSTRVHKTLQQASKQDDSIQLQGKQQVGASNCVLRHQGASCGTPQKRETLQLDIGHDASEGQRKNRDPILRNEDLEDLIESIPHPDQIIHSIQEMYPSGMNYTCHR